LFSVCWREAERGAGRTLLEALDAHELLARARPAHDLDARDRDAQPLCDHSAQRLVGATLHGRRADAYQQQPVALADDLIRARARLQADAEEERLARRLQS